MASKGGAIPVGTDGTDFLHRQRVAEHYQKRWKFVAIFIRQDLDEFSLVALVWLMGRNLKLLQGLSSMDDKSSVRKFTRKSTSKKLFLYFRPSNHNLNKMYQSESQLFSSSSFPAFNIQCSQQIATKILHILSLLAVFRDARQIVRWYFRQTGYFYFGGWRAASTETFVVSWNYACDFWVNNIVISKDLKYVERNPEVGFI